MSNLFNFSAWAASIIEVRRGTYSVSGESITITATSDDAYTYPDRSSAGGYEIPIPSNCENIKLSWLSNNDANGDVFIFGNGDVTNIYSVDNAETKELIVANNKWSKITVRFGAKYSGESITYSAISLEITYSWHIVGGQITNENFIPMPELYDTQPDALWRIDSNTNLGFPYNKLMIGLVGIDLWALDREHVIRVYDMHEPQDGFDGNGLAVLNPTVCTSLHNDERWDVELRHPLDDWGKWKNLLANNILKVDGQLFRIDISEPAIGESGREMYVHAKHITCDMADMLITFATFPGGDAARFMDFCFSSVFPADLPGYEYYSFEGYSDIRTVLGPDELVNTTVWAAMVGADNCLKNRYGGELYRDNFYFSINQRMQYAKDNAFCLRYSLDMVKIQQRVDYSDVCTNLECYDNFGNYWAVATITPTFALHHPIVRMVQFNYSEFEGAMERLAADGMAYWQTVNTPKVTYEAQIASLRRDPRYKDFVGLQNYNYGDSGTIYCPELDISTTQRITEVEKDELTGDITRMLLGNLRESLSRPTYMGSTISSGRSIEDKQNRANQNAIMSQSISGMEQFAISALELRTIDQLEGQ